MTNFWKEFKKNWKDIPTKNSKLKSIWIKFCTVSFFILFFGAGLFAMGFVIYSLRDILIRNFGYYHMHNFVLFLFASLYLTMFMFLTFIFIYSFYSSKKRNWLWLTISIMIFAFIFGLFMIDYAIGNKDLKLNLMEDGRYNGGVIDCKGNYAFVEGNPVLCKLKSLPYEMDNYSIELNYLVNGSFEKVILEDNTRFDAPPNVSYIYFEIRGTTKTGKEVYMSSGWSYHFNNKEELLDVQKKMIRDFLALLAILFITIPISVINIRKLWRDN